MGTARFLAYMTVFVILWIIFNVVGLFGFRWDPYPFILLNLFFSTPGQLRRSADPAGPEPAGGP